MQILGVTGMPSAGKGTFSKVAKQFQFHEIVMGDVIRNEVRQRGLEVNRDNSDRIMVQLREERGDDVVAEITIDWIQDAINLGKSRILIDGIRSLHEVNYFKQYFPELKIIAIHANPETRYLRSKDRKRKDDAYSYESFKQRDLVELKVGIGDVIALSDILIPSPDTLQAAKALYSNILSELIQSTEKIGVING